MKPLISIIILTLLGVCYTQTRPGYTPMAPEDYTDNTLVETLRDVGIAFLLQRAYDSGSIANQNFTINNTNYILNMTTETTWYYDMNISLVNAQDDEFEAAFIMWYFPGNDSNVIAANTYTLNYGPASGATNPNSTYVPVPPEEYVTDFIMNLANFGKDFLVRNMIRAGELPPGPYNITSINSILREDVTTGANFQFDLNFAQPDGSNPVRGEFRERYENATGNINVTAHRTSPINPLLGVPTPTNANTTDAGWTEVPPVESENATGTTAPPTDATTADTAAAIDGGVADASTTPTDTAATDAATVPTDATAAPTDAAATDATATPADAAATDATVAPADAAATDATVAPTGTAATDAATATAPTPTDAAATDAATAPTDAAATDATAAPTDAATAPTDTAAAGTPADGGVTTVPIPTATI